MSLLQTVRFIANHPLAQGRRLKRLACFARWQVASRLIASPFVHPFVEDAKLLVARGMTGATGNVYVGLHEFEDMAFVLHALRPEDLFADIGANIGSYTVLASKVVGARTVAFEPAPDTREWLELNIAVNQIGDRVEVHQAALGATRGTTKFTTNLGSSNRVLVNGQGSSNGTMHETMTVLTATLDEALKGRCPAFMKVDVEGFETAVMEGAAATLASPDLKGIVMEFNGQGAAYGFDEAALRKRMLDLDFNEYSYRPFERALVPYNGATADNVILVRDVDWVRERLKSAPCFNVIGESI
jgi:FkbM family methyltransferase